METKMLESSKKLSILNRNGGNGSITAYNHISELMEDVIGEVSDRDAADKIYDHPGDCECIFCSEKLFGGNIGERRLRRDTKESRSQRQILEDSRKVDEELIEQQEKEAEKDCSLVKVASTIERMLGFSTVIGIVLLIFNVIIRSILFPDLSAVLGSAIGIIIFALVNERMNK